jgi:hypothetical protein
MDHLDEMTEEMWQAVAKMARERRKAANVLAAALVLAVISAGTLALASMVQRQIADDIAQLRLGADELGKILAKARHPASRSRGSRSAGGSSGDPAPGPGRAPAEAGA